MGLRFLPECLIDDCSFHDLTCFVNANIHMQVCPLVGDKPPAANPEYLMVILIWQIWSMQEPLHMVHTLFQHSTSDLERNNFCILVALDDQQHHVVELTCYLDLSAKALELLEVCTATQ